MSVTTDYLLKGYALALEQCGLLLRDAVLLYRNESYANAVVLAAFAREELGRSQILLGLWRRRLTGSPVTIDDIDTACEDHVAKQRAGMLSTTMTSDRDSGLGKILTDKMTNHPQSQKFKDADAALNRIDEIKAKRTPGDRHSRRMASLYVEPRSSTDWNRPADVSATEAHSFLQDAVNDYAGRYNQGYITSAESILKHIDRGLYDALERMTDRPQLPPPEWPAFPQTSTPYADPGRPEATKGEKTNPSWPDVILATIIAAIFSAVPFWTRGLPLWLDEVLALAIFPTVIVLYTLVRLGKIG